jgi:hypothetical protein
MVAFHKDFRVSPTVANETPFWNKNPGRGAFRAHHLMSYNGSIYLMQGAEDTTL